MPKMSKNIKCLRPLSAKILLEFAGILNYCIVLCLEPLDHWQGTQPIQRIMPKMPKMPKNIKCLNAQMPKYYYYLLGTELFY